MRGSVLAVLRFVPRSERRRDRPVAIVRRTEKPAPIGKLVSKRKPCRLDDEIGEHNGEWQDRSQMRTAMPGASTRYSGTTLPPKTPSAGSANMLRRLRER